MPLDQFQFERDLLRRGCRRIAGADEAGRGPLAGPVTAAAACLPVAWIERGLPEALRGLNDSKQLSEAQRERFFEFITGCGEISFVIVSLDAAVIDSINILQASLRAMREAVAQMLPAPDHTLVDGNQRFSALHPQTPIVKGDARSHTIAAASILAKVTRDRLMREYDRQHPGYGFAEHKGYPTERHLEALARLGPCVIHRLSFAPLRARPEKIPSCETGVLAL